jgi:hypothetical protein
MQDETSAMHPEGIRYEFAIQRIPDHDKPVVLCVAEAVTDEKGFCF